MAKKRQIALAEHQEIGAALARIRDDLARIESRLYAGYAVSSHGGRAAHKLHRAVLALDEARSLLDGVSSVEVPPGQWSPEIYYPTQDSRTLPR